jgi:hypothetical protein
MRLFDARGNLRRLAARLADGNDRAIGRLDVEGLMSKGPIGAVSNTNGTVAAMGVPTPETST